MVLKSFLSRELRCSGAAFPCRRGSTGAIFMQVFSTRRHASRIIFDVKGHLNGKVGGLEVTVYAVQRLVRCVQGQDTTIPANPVFTCCSHLTTWEGLSRGKQWETGRFAISQVSICRGMAHAVLTCHKSSFFNCSYVTKKIIFQGPSLNQFGQNPLYRAKKPSFFHVCNKQSKVPL